VFSGVDHRSFRDASGNVWEAWAVYPLAVERRVTDGSSTARPNERRRHDVRLHLPEELRSGWLAFQCGDDRRRLVPIPEEWQSCAEHELCALFALAVRATATPYDE
jgi:hypothetical protein